jgi:hypothetical protein
MVGAGFSEMPSVTITNLSIRNRNFRQVKTNYYKPSRFSIGKIVPAMTLRQIERGDIHAKLACYSLTLKSNKPCTSHF